MVSKWKLSTQIAFSFTFAVVAIFMGGAIAMVAVRAVAGAALAGAQPAEIAAGAATTLWVVGGCILAVAFAVGVAGLQLRRSFERGVQGLSAELNRVTTEVAEGRLTVKASPQRVLADFHPVVGALDDVIDSFAAPIRTALAHGSSCAHGEMTQADVGGLKGDFRTLIEMLNCSASLVRQLAAETERLASALQEGRLEARAEGQGLQGAFRRMMEATNGMVTTLVGHLDAMPTPAMIVDRDLRIRYLNRAGLALTGKPMAEVAGSRCADHFRTGDCGQERCACARAIRDGRPVSSETVARPVAGTFEIAYTGSPIRDAAGQVIGALEIIVDQTATRREMHRAAKVGDYQAKATAIVTEALQGLARGVVADSVALPPGDAETEATCATYQAIAQAIVASGGAVSRLLEDVGQVAEAAMAGKLAARADEQRHQGGFQRVVKGFNETLVALRAPVEEADRVLQRLADRDLRARVTGSFQGDHARIQASTNATAQALHDALLQVAGAAAQVSSAATQIASSSQAVAAGATQQASSLQETTSSLGRVAETTRHATESAQTANALARTARTAATEGSDAMVQMQGAMAKIRASAEGTSQIIRDINDIAFQTNLLALNAAVEAARAGEAGRGFAVVAEEVRSLALRAKEAAQKTEGLIRESVKQAGEGELTSRLVAARLGEIVAGVGKVSDLVSEIAAAAKEQTSGLEQVNRSMAEMDKVTQQNAAFAEESSASAIQLSGQAEELAAMVGAFRLEDGSGPPADPRRLEIPGARPGRARVTNGGAVHHA